MNPGIFLKYKNFLKLNFSILIYTIKPLAFLLKLLYSFNILWFIKDKFLISSFLVFFFNQISFYSLSIFCSNTSLIAVLAFSIMLYYCISEILFFLYSFFSFCFFLSCYFFNDYIHFFFFFNICIYKYLIKINE